jgi:hypothetical protein
MEILTEVINEVSPDIRERIVKSIQKYTYEFVPRPNAVYEGGSGEPSYEFEQSYRWRGIRRSLREVSNELFNDWSQMTIDRVTNRHWDNGEDFRKELASAMNIEGTFAHKKRAAYWDRFLLEMDETMDRRILDKLRQKGLNVI